MPGGGGVRVWEPAPGAHSTAETKPSQGAAEGQQVALNGRLVSYFPHAKAPGGIQSEEKLSLRSRENYQLV